MILQLLVFVVILVILAWFIYILWFQKFSRFHVALAKIPGPPGWPVFGNLFELMCAPEEMFRNDRKRSKEYYPIYKEWVLDIGSVNLLHPSDIELVLSSSEHIEKSMAYSLMQLWLGTGLLTSTGSKWQTRRKILTPAFHFSILQEFVSIFNEKAIKLIEQLQENTENPIDVIPPITEFTLLSIAETSMGIKLDSLPQIGRQYQKAIYNFGYALTYRIVRPWLYNDAVFLNLTKIGRLTRASVKILHNFSRNVIAERRRHFSGERERHTNNKLAMLDLLFFEKIKGADIDDEGIGEEVDTFMFEGHDTTSMGICFTLLLLANHPKAQQEVYNEMVEVLGASIQTPTYNDLKELTFMERCVKESLRLFPSVPFIARKLKNDLVTATGYLLPKNVMAQVHIYDLHRNAEIYPEPEKFDPDRFLPENTKNRHPFAYLPFSAGPRNCIGQRYAFLEMKAVLCAILKNFVLEAIDKTEDVVIITDLVLRPKNGIRIKFTNRNK